MPVLLVGSSTIEPASRRRSATRSAGAERIIDWSAASRSSPVTRAWLVRVKLSASAQNRSRPDQSAGRSGRDSHQPPRATATSPVTTAPD
ncbi:hypothetical protein [Micromonospora sp. NPDC003776]